LCESHPEDSLRRLFFTCQRATICWETLNFISAVNSSAGTADGFAEAFLKMSSVLNEENILLLAMIIWSLWKIQNTKLW
jgi:hypothetical protein